MLTETQGRVLRAINDYCEIHGRLLLNHKSIPLPDLLTHLGLPDTEVYTAIGDLRTLGLIEGPRVAESHYPAYVTQLTAQGRQEVP